MLHRPPANSKDIASQNVILVQCTRMPSNYSVTTMVSNVHGPDRYYYIETYYFFHIFNKLGFIKKLDLNIQEQVS